MGRHNKNDYLIFFRANENFINTLDAAAERQDTTRSAFARHALESSAVRYQQFAQIVPEQASVPNYRALMGAWKRRPDTRVVGVFVPAVTKELLVGMAKNLNLRLSALAKLLIAEEMFDFDNTQWELFSIDWLVKFTNIPVHNTLRWLILTGRRVAVVDGSFAVDYCPIKLKA